MKKLLILLFTGIMMLGFLTQNVNAADAAPEFSKKFFPFGKANAPMNVYYQISKDDSGKAKKVYVWLTQPDDVIEMFNEWNYLGRDKFMETYDCTIEKQYIQIDSKLDDGDWHYMTEWDIDEYPQNDQPYDLMIRQKIVASEEQKTYCEGCALIDPVYGQDDENAGYLKPIIYSNNDEWYLDLDNHSLTLRMRYLISVTNWNMTEMENDEDGSSNEKIILSDWSNEITIGKNSTQKELVYPKSIEAPIISNLSFAESIAFDEDNSVTEWKVYVDFPISNGDAVKYYSIENDSSDPLYAVMQYRVNNNGEWSEWKDSDWGNPSWLFSGWKNFATEGISKDDTVEFRAYIRNNVEEGKDSPYTKSLFCIAGEIHNEDLDPNEIVKSGGLFDKLIIKGKCNLCGICPVQPLGICLFIWIAIVIIIIVIIILIKKGKKKKQQKINK